PLWRFADAQGRLALSGHHRRRSPRYLQALIQYEDRSPLWRFADAQGRLALSGHHRRRSPRYLQALIQY
ncbi:hypothetical protein CKF46_37735, partial [Klebsiella pneumoniae]